MGIYPVTAKKSLGQHFLNDQNIAEKIVNALEETHPGEILEVGPGTGVLTRFLLQNHPDHCRFVEVDQESIGFLVEKYPEIRPWLFKQDFLTFDFPAYYPDEVSVIGNFPYNISSQIFFKILEHRDQIPTVVCMIQKEVAERISAAPGSKTYGILSVLLQAWYRIEYLFTVNEQVFLPPPKVKSGVIRLIRNEEHHLHCDEILFKQVVKTGFNQRRKMLSNSLKSLIGSGNEQNPMLSKRPEQLSVAEFVELTNWCEKIISGKA